MFKQSLALELLLENQKMERGFDFSFKQYTEQLKKHITIELDENFINLFVKKFYSRYNSIDTIMDEFDTFFAMLETEFEIILPIYEKKFLIIQSINDDDLKDTSTLESETISKGTNKQKSEESSSASSKSFASSFPAELINHDSLEYASDGTHSNSSGNGNSSSEGENTADSKTLTTNKVGSRLDRMERYLTLQQNVIESCVDEFKKLFIMIY